MAFIDKDQKIKSWQTKTKHNFIETSVTSQTFADHRLTSLGTYQRLENISHGSRVRLLCMLS